MNFVIVDVETTGGNTKDSKITEIAMYKYDGEKVIDSYVSLVNPEQSIPEFIVRLTGITDSMVADAPKFYEIAKEVIEFTKGLLVSNYAQYGIPAPEDKELTESAMQVLQNREESTRIFDMLAEQKLTNYFKETVKLNEKEISYDAFIELASK